MISKEVGIQDTKRCPTCGKHVMNDSLTFCSNKCKDNMENEVRSASANNKELQTLMRQYRTIGWGPVD